MFPPSLAHRGRGHEGAISALPSPLTAKIVTVGTSGCCDSGQRARGGGRRSVLPPTHGPQVYRQRGGSGAYEFRYASLGAACFLACIPGHAVIRRNTEGG